MRDVKTRSQRRVERNQVVVLLALMLVVSVVSFALGWLVGQGGRTEAPLAETETTVRQAVPAATEAAPQAAPEEAPKVNLTFYDTLPKGEATPLGSGINLPPEGEPAKPEVSATVEPARPVAAKPSAAPAPQTSAAQPKPAPATSGEYVVQVASFQSHDDAEALQARLLARGNRAYLQTVDLGSKGVWTRVYIGFFRTEAEAQKIAERVKATEKITPIVRKR